MFITPLGPEEAEARGRFVEILATRSGHNNFRAAGTAGQSASWTLSGLILALIMALDTSIASQLTQEEKIQLAIKAPQDGTISSQRKADPCL
jgi:hypothetical protein